MSPASPSPPCTAAGYFDQAHFGHEFKALLDVTPAEYAAQCRDATARER